MWKQLLSIAAIVFVGVLIEVSLIYVGKVIGGLPFAISVRPQVEMF